VKCIQMLAGTNMPFSGEKRALYTSHHENRKLVIRFATSIALGIAYGRRILDLNDEMVTFNHKSALGM
jgi:hypothetical protein